MRNLYLSVDPTQRGWMAGDTYLPAVKIGEVMRSFAVGEVAESRHPAFKPGQLVQGLFGWQDWAIARPGTSSSPTPVPSGVPVETAMSVLGLTGITAYFGLLDVGRPKPGETVVVSGAAGATGSAAAQIAKIAGCRVIGIAGGPEKCAYLTGELGPRRRRGPPRRERGQGAPGALPEGDRRLLRQRGRPGRSTWSSAQLAMRGRIVLCGGIAHYNDALPARGPANYLALVMKRGRMEGFIVLDYLARAGEAVTALSGLAARRPSQGPGGRGPGPGERPGRPASRLRGEEPGQAAGPAGRPFAVSEPRLVVVAPDSFKGSLSAVQAAEAMERGVLEAWPDARVVKIPIADGGEGTVEALVTATGGRYETCTVRGPLGRPVEARWGVLGDGRTAVVEMAAASGLTLVPEGRRDPRIASTFGTGQLIRAALDAGFRRIVIGIGGSATNDGGSGMAKALGVRFLDGRGDTLPEGGAALSRLASVDLSGVDPRLAGTEILVACDVDNPLTGPRGASAVYGPQKGATPAVVAELDAALERYAPRSPARPPGATWRAFRAPGRPAGSEPGCSSSPRRGSCPGIDLVLDSTRFDDQVRGASLVVVGEGRTDHQTAMGKAPVGVARVAPAPRGPGAAGVGQPGAGRGGGPRPRDRPDRAGGPAGDAPPGGHVPGRRAARGAVAVPPG